MIAAKRQKQLDFWTRHIETKRAGDITRAAYCRSNDLNLPKMIYWERRLGLVKAETGSGSRAPGRAFVKAVVDDKSSVEPIIPTAGNKHFRLRFPCGLVLELDNT
jgi:hypothetical protein